MDKNGGKAKGSVIDLKVGIFNTEVNAGFSRPSLHHGVVLFSLGKNSLPRWKILIIRFFNKVSTYYEMWLP